MFSISMPIYYGVSCKHWLMCHVVQEACVQVYFRFSFLCKFDLNEHSTYNQRVYYCSWQCITACRYTYLKTNNVRKNLKMPLKIFLMPKSWKCCETEICETIKFILRPLNLNHLNLVIRVSFCKIVNSKVKYNWLIITVWI